MTFADGLLLGILGMLLTIVGFMIAMIIYNKSVQKIKKEKQIKETKLPYDFK